MISDSCVRITAIKLSTLAVMLLVFTVPAAPVQAQFALSGELFLESTQTHKYADVNLDSDTYTGRFSMLVAPTDVGKSADLFLAAFHQGKWYQKTTSSWIPWDADPVTLVPYESTVLAATLQFDIVEAESLPSGSYQIFVAYQAAGEGFTTSTTPIAFSIVSMT